MIEPIEAPPRWNDRDYKDPDCLLTNLWLFPDGERKGLPDYHGCMIPALPRQLIQRFTDPGDLVWDPMCGSGTTLVEALKLGRRAAGMDLSPKAIDLSTLATAPYSSESHVSLGDATKTLAIEPESAALVMLHPPYHDIIKFSEDDKDLSRVDLATIDEAKEIDRLHYFLGQFAKIARLQLDALKPKGHLALVMGDYYRGGEWIPLGFRTMDKVLISHLYAPTTKGDAHFVLKGIITKDIRGNRAKRGQANLWRCRTLKAGSFLFETEQIFVFQKQSKKYK
jgi:DNA modification methylase